MLVARQDESVIQPLKIQLLRTREQQNGTGIFYHVPLRREVLVPIDPKDWFNPHYNMGAAGLSSNIEGTFTHIPDGMKPVPLWGILGTIVQEEPVKIVDVDGKAVHRVVKGSPCMMEILEPDLKLIQEQNQMSLLLDANCVVHFNAQDYGTGTTEDGRQRDILRGSFWAVPQWYLIGYSRTEARSAAVDANQIDAILEYAQTKNADRAMNARAQSRADRAERDERRAAQPMPLRRGTNASYGVGR